MAAKEHEGLDVDVAWFEEDAEVVEGLFRVLLEAFDDVCLGGVGLEEGEEDEVDVDDPCFLGDGGGVEEDG